MTLTRTYRVFALAVLAAFAALVAIVITAPNSDSTTPAPTPTAFSNAQYPAGLPPFWHKQAPSWCYEDEPCWIGSVADDRTDAQSYAAWYHVAFGSYACQVKIPGSIFYLSRCIDLYHIGGPGHFGPLN